ncbi:MAG: alpha/beta fold hydrolase, partial [Acidobacteria bacterium]|nr:alpha/beta fold hydrolase [Acidobacteriota bacterium]
CITGIIDAREQPQLDDGMVIEEGSIPGAFAALLPKTFAVASALIGKDTDSGVADMVQERGRELDSLVRGSYYGAVHNTQTFLVMTHDDAAGRLYLEEDRVRIAWPGVGQQPIFEKVNERLEQATRSLGGTYLKNPLSTKLTNHDLITVHPLGGCVMAESAESGVVNHKGQVFSGDAGTAVYEDLYVCDGSIIPRPLGVNPLLTISALSERCCVLLAMDRGWQINYDLPSAPLSPSEPLRTGIQFTETMCGHFSTKVKDDYERAEEQGIEDDSTFQFTLTIASRDLEHMLNDPQHPARMTGTVTAPALSADPLMVTEGEINLFVEDPDHVGTRHMRYRMKMSSEEGRVYYFSGFKVIHDDRGVDLWSDTTTLYITIYDGDSMKSPEMGKGILKIRPSDFMRQLTTMQVTNSESVKEYLAAKVRFGRLFGGVLFETYGGIFAGSNVFNPDTPPRKRRLLRAGVPQVYLFNTSDGVQLRLTRYQGGKKGPVILSHGLGVSSLIYSTDTIETNLVEYLFAHGFDVWLLDHRASIELPASADQFTADDIATKDYPAAVDKVRELTGAESVQIVAHCIGSTTLFMSLLDGLQGVRSAVSSQGSLHIVAPTATRIKCGLYLPSFMEALSIDSLTGYVDTNANWVNRLYDKCLKLYPIEDEERCRSLVCPRVAFMYGQLYEHDQLNTATHDAMHELFGIANISTFNHLAMLVRAGHLVNARGEDVYLPNLGRLAIPIAFIHGAENECFLPEGSRLTYQLLRETHDKSLYNRHVIPNYGHIDCIFGKNAARDVYPLILNHLAATAT